MSYPEIEAGGAVACRVAGIEDAGRLGQRWFGFVFETVGDDEHLSAGRRAEPPRKSMRKTPSVTMEVSFFVVVPNEIALKPYELGSVVVHRGNDFRLPLFVEQNGLAGISYWRVGHVRSLMVVLWGHATRPREMFCGEAGSSPSSLAGARRSCRPCRGRGRYIVGEQGRFNTEEERETRRSTERQRPAVGSGGRFCTNLDGSQFAAAMEPVLIELFATADGYVTITNALFKDMFTAKSDKVVVDAVMERASRLPRAVGEKMLTDMLRYDVGRLSASLVGLRVPVMALQTTYSNEKRDRRSMSEGRMTPYLDMVRASIPSVRVEVIADTGHFPQIDESVRTNAAIEGFLGTLRQL